MSISPGVVIAVAVIIGLIAGRIVGGLIGLGIGIVISGIIGMMSYKTGSLVPMSLAVDVASRYMDDHVGEVMQLRRYLGSEAGVRQFLVRILNHIAAAASVNAGSRDVGTILHPEVYLASRNDALALIYNQYPQVAPVLLSMTSMNLAEFAVCSQGWPGRLESELDAHQRSRSAAADVEGDLSGEWEEASDEDLPF